MAHELDMTNGRANMAYTGELPWHGLGRRLTGDADLETWTKEAGMEWEVHQTPVIYNGMTFAGRHVLYRSDSTAPLGIVSDDYNIVQPKQVMEFFRDLIADQGMKMETAGCLFGGRKFWALARCGETARLMGQDEVNPYLLLATSCDGSMSTVAHPTSVRVVCNNTLRMSIGANAAKARIRVPHNAMFDGNAVKAELGLVEGAWDNFVGEMNRLAKLKLARDEAIQLVADELKDEWKTAEGEQMTTDDMMESSTVLRRIIKLYDGEGLGAQFRSSKGTAWGLVNAVTQFFDHEVAPRGDRSRAFERAHLTDRANLKVSVANSLLKLAA